MINNSPVRRCELRAFTVVELLVTLGVISLLLALLVPAVQSSRESSRRIDCTNRLRQIAQGTHSFEGMHGHFPEFSSGGRDWQGRRHWNVCPLVEILPHVEQTPVFDQIDRAEWQASFDAYSGRQLYSPQNAHLIGLTIPLYQCPSDQNRPGSCNYRANLGTGADWTPVPPSPPQEWCVDPKSGNGAFELMKELKPQSFSDGLSNTVMYSERVIGDGDGSRYSPWRDYSQVDDAWPTCTSGDLRSTCFGIAGIARQHASFAGYTWAYASKAHTAYDHILPPNSAIPDCARDSAAAPDAMISAMSARSQHPGVVNVAMGDGAVRAVSESIDETVWHELGSRNGVDEPE